MRINIFYVYKAAKKKSLLILATLVSSVLFSQNTVPDTGRVLVFTSGNTIDLRLAQIESTIGKILSEKRVPVYLNNLSDTINVSFSQLKELPPDPYFQDMPAALRFTEKLKLKKKIINSKPFFFLSPVPFNKNDTTQCNFKLDDLKTGLSPEDYAYLENYVLNNVSNTFSWKAVDVNLNRNYANSIWHLWYLADEKCKAGDLKVYSCFNFPFISKDNQMSGEEYKWLKRWRTNTQELDGPNGDMVIMAAGEGTLAGAFVMYESKTKKPFAINFSITNGNTSSNGCDTCVRNIVFFYEDLQPFLQPPQLNIIQNLIDENYFNDVYVQFSNMVYPAQWPGYKDYVISAVKYALEGKLTTLLDPQVQDLCEKYKILDLLNPPDSVEAIESTEPIVTLTEEEKIKAVPFAPYLAIIKVWNRPDPSSYKHLGFSYAVGPVVYGRDSILKVPFYWYLSELTGINGSDSLKNLLLISEIDKLQSPKKGKFTITADKDLKGQNLTLQPVNLPGNYKAGDEITIVYEGWDNPGTIAKSFYFTNAEDNNRYLGSFNVYITDIIADKVQPAEKKKIPIPLLISAGYSISADPDPSQSYSGTGVFKPVSYLLGGNVLTDNNLNIIKPRVPYQVPFGHFSEGYLMVSKFSMFGPTYNFMDEAGVLLKNKFYDAARNFRNGYAAIGFKRPEKWGFIDKKGNEIKPEYEEVNDFYFEMAAVKQNNKWGWINTAGKIICTPKFEYAGNFNGEKIINVKAGKKYGFAGKKGKIKIDTTYDYALPFSEKLAGVKIKDKWGFINKKGKQIIKLQFDSVENFSEGRAAAKLNGKWGYIDYSGAFVIQPVYLKVTSFNEGCAYGYFAHEGKLQGLGFIDKAGKLINDIKSDYTAGFYSKEAKFSNGLFIFCRDYQYFATADGKTFFKIPY